MSSSMGGTPPESRIGNRGRNRRLRAMNASRTATIWSGAADVQAPFKHALLIPGKTPIWGNGEYRDARSIEMSDGLLEVHDRHSKMPSGAGQAAVGQRAGIGWWFCDIDVAEGPRLHEVRHDLASDEPMARTDQ